MSCDGSLTKSGSSQLNTKHYFLLDYHSAANTDTRHYQAFHSDSAGSGEPRIMLSFALDGPLIILLQICGQDRIVKILQKFPLQIKLVHKIKKTVFRGIIIAHTHTREVCFILEIYLSVHLLYCSAIHSPRSVDRNK